MGFPRPSPQPVCHAGAPLPLEREPREHTPNRLQPQALTSVVPGPPRGQDHGCAGKHLSCAYCVLDIKISKWGTQFRGKATCKQRSTWHSAKGQSGACAVPCQQPPLCTPSPLTHVYYLSSPPRLCTACPLLSIPLGPVLYGGEESRQNYFTATWTSPSFSTSFSPNSSSVQWGNDSRPCLNGCESHVS